MSSLSRGGGDHRSVGAALEALDRARGDLERVGGLPHPTEAQAIWRRLWIEDTHGSTSIEGNPLSEPQVTALLDDDVALGGQSMAAYLEVSAYARAAQWVYAHAVAHRSSAEATATINLTELRHVHELLIGPVWEHVAPHDLRPEEGPGGFRVHDILAFPDGMRPPEWPEVPHLMTDWVDRANEPRAASEHVVLRVSALHAEFERIHPFRDGNGRTGRLAMNLMLVRSGYPPALIAARQRREYLAALDRSDRGDAGPLVQLTARSIRDGIERVLLPALAGDHRLIPLAALERPDLSVRAMIAAARRDRLRAVREGGRWYATRGAVEEYLASRR